MRTLLLVLILAVSLTAQSQDNSRSLCIFDMQERNSESNDARIFSCEQMAIVAGVPSVISTDLSEAFSFGVILFSSEFKSSSFSS